MPIQKRVLFVVACQHGLKAVALEQGQIVRTGMPPAQSREADFIWRNLALPGCAKNPRRTFGGLSADKIVNGNRSSSEPRFRCCWSAIYSESQLPAAHNVRLGVHRA